MAATPPPADVLIRGGTVYTGDDAPAFVGDVAIRGDKIVAVGTAPTRARRIIDARGLIVAPGFIDPHTHPDRFLNSADPAQRRLDAWTYQGVTTIVTGVDGSGTPEVAQRLARLATDPTGTNVATHVGFGAIRQAVIGPADRAPSADELLRMRTLVAKGMCEGALGLSAGLFYAPQRFADTGEVIALAMEAARRGGFYDTHQRDESSYGIGLKASVAEVLRIGREAGLPVHFSHIKALGVDVHGMAPSIVAMIDAARAAGQQVTADQYPYTASGSNLAAALLPGWTLDGGAAALQQRLGDAPTVARLRPEIADNLRRRGGADAVLMTSAGAPWTGQTLSAVAAGWHIDPIDAALRILRTQPALGDIASFNMVPADIATFMRQPWVITGSDGSDGHPRMYGTFPEKFAHYVERDKVIDRAAFIRRSTGLTADILHLDRRGYLRPGWFADVVVFNPATFAPQADYVHPERLARGVRTLFVNGVAAIDGGTATGARSGRPLPGKPPPGSCPD